MCPKISTLPSKPSDTALPQISRTHMRGVLDVIDEIEVDPVSPMDDRIRIQVARSIYGYGSLSKYAIDPGKPIRISVQNGSVTLFGLVDSQMDKDVAGLRANGVSNIFKVTNQSDKRSLNNTSPHDASGVGQWVTQNSGSLSPLLPGKAHRGMIPLTVPLTPAAEAVDLRQQQTAFGVLTLFVLALLLVLHALFASILGEPSLWLILLLGLGFSLKVAELIWLQSLTRLLTERAARIETTVSIVAMFALTALLAYLTNRDDSPYFVLLAIPILQCAYLFGLYVTVLTIAAADSMILFWLWHFFLLHPPARATEYLEAGMISIIYLLMGLLVWFLVNQLKSNQARLSFSLNELRATRERLVSEEKLAAVGRLASGIAHEIRNPVAMISSALTTANHPMTKRHEQQEMFVIAARESERLERLTADFLTYARPTVPQRLTVDMRELLAYIADVTRMHAAKRPITVVADLDVGLPVQVDASLMEGALLNLTLNAVDATPENGKIELRAALKENLLCIEIQNSGPAIPASVLERIFEPFFTTKPTGTGLGLAIARGIARAHGGDLWVSRNVNDSVTFSMTVAESSAEDVREGATHG